jgi:hypothetical protein
LKQEFIVPNNVSVNQLITNYVNKTNIELKNVLKNESEFYRSYNVSLDISKQETCNPKILMDCFNKRNVLKYGLSNYFMKRIIYSIKVNQIIFSLTEYKQK